MATRANDIEFIKFNQKRIKELEQKIDKINAISHKSGQHAIDLNESKLLLQYYKKNIDSLVKVRGYTVGQMRDILS